MRILGLDPANVCGYATFDNVASWGTWKLKLPSDKHEGRRLERLYRHLFEIHRDLNIDVIGYEEAGFGSQLAKTQASHNELIGVIKMFAAKIEVPTYGYVPTTLKAWFTGSGRAKKQQMIDACKNVFGHQVRDDNEADAIAVMERLKFDLQKEAKANG